MVLWTSILKVKLTLYPCIHNTSQFENTKLTAFATNHDNTNQDSSHKCIQSKISWTDIRADVSIPFYIGPTCEKVALKMTIIVRRIKITNKILAYPRNSNPALSGNLPSQLCHSATGFYLQSHLYHPWLLRDKRNHHCQYPRCSLRNRHRNTQERLKGAALLTTVETF